MSYKYQVSYYKMILLSFSIYFIIINSATQLDLEGDKENTEPNELQWEHKDYGVFWADGGKECSPKLPKKWSGG